MAKKSKKKGKHRNWIAVYAHNRPGAGKHRNKSERGKGKGKGKWGRYPKHKR